MAEQNEQSQNLQEFTSNLLEDLTSGSITPEEALIAMEQYGFLRDMLANSYDILASSLTDTDSFSQNLRGLVEKSIAQLNQNLPQLRRESPDSPRSPADISERAKALERARGQLKDTLGQRQSIVSDDRRDFVEALVKNWVTQSRRVISEEQAIREAAALRQTLTDELARTSNPQEAFTQAKRVLAQTTKAPPALLDQAFQATRPTLEKLSRDSQGLSRMAQAPRLVLKHTTTERSDWFTAILLEQLQASELPVSQVEIAAATLTRTAEAIASPAVTTTSLLQRGIFQSFAQTGVQKAFAGIADGAFLFLGPTTRDRVLQIVLAKTASRLLSDTDALTKRLGGSFVDSEVFAQIKRKLQETIATPREGGSPLSKTKSLVGDLFTTVVRSPMGERLVGSPREAILNYLELLRINASLPPDKRLVGANAPSITWQHIYMAGMYASPESGFIPGGLARSPTSEERPAGFLGFLMGAAGGLGSVIGGPLGWIAGGPSGGLLGVFNRGLGGLMSGVGLGRWLEGARRRASIATRVVDDLPLLIAIVVVSALVILFVLPTSLNPDYLARVSRSSALLCAQYTGAALCGSQLAELPLESTCDPTTNPACAAAFCDSTMQDCSWPIEGYGCIIQGPGGDYSHDDLNAIDISAPRGTIIRATHDGTVMGCNGDGGLFRTGMAYGQFAAGYGNVVQIQGTDDRANNYSTIYGHMEFVYVKPCDTIKKGQPLGTMDDTGFSTGDHLHYEYRGGGSINSILPDGAIVGACLE